MDDILHQWCKVSSIHIDGIWTSSNWDANCLNHHELANLQKFDGMVNSIMNEACGKHAQLEILVFYYGWCPTRSTGIMVGFILTSNFLYIFTN